jgi:hypothetical protein
VPPGQFHGFAMHKSMKKKGRARPLPAIAHVDAGNVLR